MRDGSDDCYTAVADMPGEPSPQDSDAADFDVFGEAIRKYKALCYEDICLWVVQNPRKGERDALAMEVHLWHHEGVDKKPKPTTFLFRENTLPILCPISHILTRATRDNAILVNGYTSAGPFFTTNLRGRGMRAMKVHWKPKWLKQPVFHRSVRLSGCWVKSKTEPMLYSAYAFYINRLGRKTGFEDELTSYYFRRGTANAIDGVASNAVRD